MSEEINERNGLPAELKRVEKSLLGIVPAKAELDRDRVMFEAGRADARSGWGTVRRWQGLCGVLAAACVGLAVAPREGKERVVEKTVVVRVADDKAERSRAEVPIVRGMAAAWVEAGSVQSAGVGDYLALRRELMTGGVHVGSKDEVRGVGMMRRAFSPTLKSSEGLDALPAWQQRTVLLEGMRS